MLEFNRSGHPLSKEEMENIAKMQKRDNRSGNFRWVVAGITVLTLSICWIRNRYGKPLIEIHTTQKTTEEKKKPKNEKKPEADTK